VTVRGQVRDQAAHDTVIAQVRGVEGVVNVVDEVRQPSDVIR
jgi:osmotically-inducible protein OsmY